MVSTPPSLRGRRVLVVEDDFVVAEETAYGLERYGATVMGPALTVREALGLLEAEGAPDFAVLDVNLGGERVYPVAEALRASSTRFVFATGYAAELIDPRFAGAPVCEKPVSARRLARALLSFL